MSAEELITKVTQIIPREDGSEVRIVATSMSRIFGDIRDSIDIYVHRRESSEHEWKLCSKDPHPDWRNMSVDEYTKRGRSEFLQTVKFGELVRVTSLIGQPISCLH